MIEFSKGKLTDNLIMFFLLGVSAMPYFSSNQAITIVFPLILIGLYFKQNNKIDKEFYYIIFAIFSCIFFQSIIFSYFKLITILGLIIKILTGYLVVKLLRENFINYYLRIMVFLSIISLVVFIPIILHKPLLDMVLNSIPSFLSYQYDLFDLHVDQKTLLIYNFNLDIDYLRNCGPFWEPGAFGGFLIIALIFNTIRENGLSNKTNWLYGFTIISTQSTTAYLALFAFITGFLLLQNYSLRSKLLLIVVVIGGMLAFQKIPFLNDKIQNENQTTQEAIEKGGDTRIGSAILDWNDIKSYPYTGRGIWPETRIDKKFEYVSRNNGFTNFFAEWGFFFMFLYFYYYYRGFDTFCELYNVNNNYIPFIMLGTIWLVSFSENYFSLPFFWALVFLNIPLKTYLEENSLSLTEESAG